MSEEAAAVTVGFEELHVCVLCSRTLVAAGAEAVTGPRLISIGRHCEAHPGEFVNVQASHVVVVPVGGWVRPSYGGERARAAVPTTAGPVTLIAAQLLAAWTVDGADEAMIAGAIDAAEILLRRTKGA